MFTMQRNKLDRVVHLFHKFIVGNSHSHQVINAYIGLHLYSTMEPIVSIKDCNIFIDKHLILKDVNFDINKGEFIYLIGKTGTGKSSLLKTLYGELEMTDGEGTVGDFNLRKLKRKQVPHLRRTLGIVFQDFQLLTDRSVAENLIFVMKATGWKDKNKMKARIQEVLEKVELGTKGFKMPHELSGGEQQRLAIARALINDPVLILADEPTGNLDPETSDNILRLLFDISQSGRSVLMATHDYVHMSKYGNRTIKCEAGEIVDSRLEQSASQTPAPSQPQPVAAEPAPAPSREETQQKPATEADATLGSLDTPPSSSSESD
jgi:cell division transport system ATP-binding protein